MQVVESVLVVNPGYLSKRRAAGTYAKLTIRPYSMTEEERIAAMFQAQNEQWNAQQEEMSK